MEVARGTIAVWSDLGCPWSHAVVWRLWDARRRLGLVDRVRFDHHAFPLELFNSEPTPRRRIDAEWPVAERLAPRAGWQPWSAPPESYPVTLLPPMEAVLAAKEQSLAASEELDRGLRRAFFAESRCISLRHVILEVGSECDSLDLAALADGARRRPARAAAHGRLGDGARRRGPGLRAPVLPTARTPRTPASRSHGTATSPRSPATTRRRSTRSSRAPPADLTGADGGAFHARAPATVRDAHRRPRHGAAPLPRGLHRADRGRGLPPGDLHVRAPRLSLPQPRREPARLALHDRAPQGDRSRPSRPAPPDRAARRRWSRRHPRPPTPPTTGSGDASARCRRSSGRRSSIASCSTSPTPRSARGWARPRRRRAAASTRGSRSCAGSWTDERPRATAGGGRAERPTSTSRACATSSRRAPHGRGSSTSPTAPSTRRWAS